MTINNRFYIPFNEIPGSRVRVAQDSRFILAKEAELAGKNPTFWSKREVGFIIARCHYEEGHVFYNEQDRNYQRAICGFFDDMWLHYKSSLSHSTLQTTYHIQQKFTKCLKSAEHQYINGMGISYEAPLFFTMTARLIQCMPGALNGRDVVNAMQELGDIIIDGNEHDIKQGFEVLVQEINRFAGSYLISLFRT